MTETDSRNRRQTQGGSREGAAGGSDATNRRPYEQKRTERPGLSDGFASKHEILKLLEAGQVESEGATGKFGVLLRETSSEAAALEEESAAVVVEGWTWKTKTGLAPKDRRVKAMTLILTLILRRTPQKERAAAGLANRNSSPACGCPTVKPVKQPQPAQSRKASGRRKERNRRQVSQTCCVKTRLH